MPLDQGAESNKTLKTHVAKIGEPMRRLSQSDRYLRDAYRASARRKRLPRDIISIDIGGFIGDTMHMSAEEIGAYFLILIFVWRSEDGIPDDDRMLAKITKLSSRKWKNIRPSIMPFFEVRGNILYPIARHLPPRRRLVGTEWAAIRSQVFERDNWTCRYCGSIEGNPECDHVIPISRGGSNDIANLATACGPCNSSKRDKLLEEWRGAR